MADSEHDFQGKPGEAANMAAIFNARNHHNETCNLGPAIEVQMNPFDVRRMGWEDGDMIAGLQLASNPRVQPDKLKILCAGDKEEESKHATAPVALPVPSDISRLVPDTADPIIYDPRRELIAAEVELR